MCGVAGFVGVSGPEITAGVVRAMLGTLQRRGPDGEGTHSWPGVTLGHRRLAIIDLSDAGRQPMISRDGTVGLVFNGCIYNFMELRRELENAGHRFSSQCDTEVLLIGYQEWGIDGMLPRLRGMFAFAIWDDNRRTLFMVRDRLGVKPLVYAVRGKEIAFASTVGALQEAGFGGEINPAAVLGFLEFGVITDEYSIFQEIHKVPASTMIEWREGRIIRERCYWQIPEIDESSRITFEEAVEETERLLLEAVKTRLCADVPIGALLSGGVDSSLICWALTKLNANIKAFTVGVPGHASDESAAAAETAQSLGIPHEIITVDHSEEIPLEELFTAYSEPFACQSAHGMLNVSRAVKKLATVLLTGDGGDDVFLGYPYFFNAWRAQKLARRLPDAAAGVWSGIRPVADRIGPLRRGKHFLDYATGGLGAYSRVREGIQYFHRHALLGERLQHVTMARRDMPASMASARNLVQDVFHYHLKTHFTGEFMVKVDGATMRHSIEARSPLLDQRLWELAAALPPALRFHQDRTKAVLRELARRRLGDGVAYRRKQGFTVPIERWLTQKWRHHLEHLRSDSTLVRDGWIDRRNLTSEIDRAFKTDHAPEQLWYVLVLDYWMSKQHTKQQHVRSAEITVR